jgi:hypothetical protein
LNILISITPNLNQSHALGLARCLEGINTHLWDVNVASPIDVFDRIKPDIFIGDILCVTKGMVSCAKKYNTSLLLYDCYNNDIRNSKVELLQDVKNKCNILTYLPYQIYRDIKAEYFWTKRGFLSNSLLTAADELSYNTLEDTSVFKSDITVIDDESPENKVIVESLAWKYPEKTIKIFGKGWKIPQSCGIIPETLYPTAIKSADIFLQLSGDIIDTKLWGAGLLKTPTITNKNRIITSLFGPDFHQFSSIDNLFKIIDTIKNNDKTEEIFNKIESSHRYFNRIEEIQKILQRK